MIIRAKVQINDNKLKLNYTYQGRFLFKGQGEGYTAW